MSKALVVAMITFWFGCLHNVLINQEESRFINDVEPMEITDEMKRNFIQPISIACNKDKNGKVIESSCVCFLIPSEERCTREQEEGMRKYRPQMGGE